MGEVMPKCARVPRIGRAVKVVVGSPVSLEDLAARCADVGEDKRCVWKEITERIEEALRELERQVPPNPDQVPKVGG